MKKKTIVMLLALATLSLAVFASALVSRERAQQKEAQQAALLRQAQIDQLRPLMRERQALQREIHEIRGALSEKERKAGMAAILYRSPSQRLQENALGLMHAYGVQGTILLTPQAFPGEEGYLSVDALRELTDAGWDLCVPCLNADDMRQLLDRIDQCGLPAPQSLFLEENMHAQAAACAAQWGLNGVIYTGQMAESTSETVFAVRAYSHQTDAAAINAAFEPLQSGRSYLAVTVGFDATDADAYNHDRMDSILDYCVYYGITVAPVSALAADGLPASAASADQAALAEKLEGLNQQLADVRQQIDAINSQLGQD